MAQIAINVTERIVIRGKVRRLHSERRTWAKTVCLITPDWFCRHCLRLQEWNGGTKRVLALHGWLDNAASFNYLGPQLAKVSRWAVVL